MSPRRWLVLSLVLVLLAGCATPGTVKSDLWTRLTPAEQKEADALTLAVDRLSQACQKELETKPGNVCPPPPRIWVHGNGTWAHYDPNTHTIQLPHAALNPYFRASLAHELAHAWFADARGTGGNCQTEAQAEACEDAANFHAPLILTVGYSYDAPTAINLVWQMLVRVLKQDKHQRGHADTCRELHAFETKIGAPSLYPCTEVATR